MKILLLFTLMLCQLSQSKIQAQNDLDYSSDQIAGYFCTGLGITTIAYTALGYNNTEKYNNNSAVFYCIGTGLLISGIYLLIKGEKKEPYQYEWKGPGPVPQGNARTSCYLRFLFDDTATD
jgi:hypothetical protein